MREACTTPLCHKGKGHRKMKRKKYRTTGQPVRPGDQQTPAKKERGVRGKEKSGTEGNSPNGMK